MPIKFEDVVQHVSGIPNRDASTKAVLDAVASRMASAGGKDELNAAVQELRDHTPALLRAINQSGPGSLSNLGPGETPKYLDPEFNEDGSMKPRVLAEQMSADDAETLGNPIIPRDTSGHKVHPADALGTAPAGASTINQAKAQGFGGDGGRSEELLGSGRTETPSAALAEPPAHPAPREEKSTDPKTGEIITRRIAFNGEVLSESRAPAPVNEPV